MAEIKMVVGLGNPGDEYVDTRHNAGFRVIDLLSCALKIDVRKKKFGACFGQGEFARLGSAKPRQADSSAQGVPRTATE